MKTRSLWLSYCEEGKHSVPAHQIFHVGDYAICTDCIAKKAGKASK